MAVFINPRWHFLFAALLAVALMLQGCIENKDKKNEAEPTASLEEEPPKKKRVQDPNKWMDEPFYHPTPMNKSEATTPVRETVTPAVDAGALSANYVKDMDLADTQEFERSLASGFPKEYEVEADARRAAEEQAHGASNASSNNSNSSEAGPVSANVDDAPVFNGVVPPGLEFAASAGDRDGEAPTVEAASSAPRASRLLSASSGSSASSEQATEAHTQEQKPKKSATVAGEAVAVGGEVDAPVPNIKGPGIQNIDHEKKFAAARVRSQPSPAMELSVPAPLRSGGLDSSFPIDVHNRPSQVAPVTPDVASPADEARNATSTDLQGGDASDASDGRDAEPAEGLESKGAAQIPTPFVDGAPVAALPEEASSIPAAAASDSSESSASPAAPAQAELATAAREPEPEKPPTAFWEHTERDEDDDGLDGEALLQKQEASMMGSRKMGRRFYDLAP
eukprot:gb/GFBE01063150.1/.p1 GENE.gb/GFBE01063150.1/~~gb/GFBE01063150.1/.p1  ORF type:complete len:452 (+),score=97.90 gb/GFBE01063150.1/:1-1356(+)